MAEAIAVPGRYHASLRQWLPYTSGVTQAATLEQLTIATFNVWFAPTFFNERCQALLALLAQHTPDIIALQEVTPAFLQQILSEPWVQADYSVSDISGDSVDPYGVLLLSRIPIADWQFLPLPTAMGRQLVIARAHLNQTSTTFAGVHLESLRYAAPTRAKQLARIFAQLAPEQHVALLGDFNFCASWDENQQLDPAYQDLWPLLHPEQPGFTHSAKSITLPINSSDTATFVRFDRVLLRSQTPGWRAETIELIGTEPISGTTTPIFPSDHFGLVCQLRWQNM